MGPHQAIENHAAADAETDSSVYVPSLQLTEGQPPPIAANGGLSYMSFDRDGDGGTTAAIEAALDQIAEGRVQAFIDRIESAPPGPIETQWGLAFRGYEECLDHIRANDIEAPEGGLALPLRYTVYEQPSYSIVSSNALWRDPARRCRGESVAQGRREQRAAQPLLPAGAARRAPHRRVLPRSLVRQPRMHGQARRLAGAPRIEVRELLRPGGGGTRVLPRNREAPPGVFPDATDALVYNHDVFDKDYQGDRTEDQDARNPGVNASYVNLVHNDLNDNSGRVRCRELLTKNLRNFGREQHCTEAEADAKMSRRFMSINLAKPMETVGQFPFVLCAWPSFADQPYINNYRVYDDRVGETTRFTYRPDHEWYWFPRQKPTEVSMLKCYDSVADGSVSRWSFHSACIDPTAPADAPCRKNVVVRSYVFF